MIKKKKGAFNPPSPGYCRNAVFSLQDRVVFDAFRVVFCAPLGDALIPPDERILNVTRFLHRRIEAGNNTTLAKAAKCACMTPQAYRKLFSVVK